MPSLEEAVGLPPPEGGDGRSLEDAVGLTASSSPSIGEAIGQGLMNIPGSLIKGIGQLGSSIGQLFTPEGYLQAEQAGIGPYLKGAASGLTAGIYSPTASNPTEAAQQTVGSAAGAALPFTGLLKALGLAGMGARAATPIAGAVMGAAEPLSRGDPTQALQEALTGAGSSALASEFPNILQRTARLPFRPGTTPVRAAEATQASNIAHNAVNREDFLAAQQAQQQSIQRLEAFRLQQQQAQQLSQASIAEKATRVSDKEQALRQATRTAPNPASVTEHAWDFINQNQQLPPIAMPNLAKAAEEKLATIKEMLPSTRPAQAAKVLGEIGKATGESSSVPAGYEGLGPDAMQQLVEQLGGLSRGTNPSLNQVRGIQLGLKNLIKSNDSNISGVGRYLYKQLMSDVETAAKTVPEAAQLKNALQVSHQNFGAEELADWMTNHGTRVGPTGAIELRSTGPEMLAQKLREGMGTDGGKRDPFALGNSLRPEALDNINAALQDVFHTRSNTTIKPSDIISPSAKPSVLPSPKAPKTRSEGFEPKRTEGILARHPFISGGLAGSVLGLPHAAGIALALAYPRAIFHLMLTPMGRSLARSLYAKIPPMAGDMARYGAVVNFLHSQGDTSVEPIPEYLQWQQQQQAAQQQAQQAQQQQQMMQMLQQQQGDKGGKPK